MRKTASTPRCGWAGDDPLMVAYHDGEWGVPAHDDRKLFEMLLLEGAQAGLSWRTILHKRAAYRRAFAGFDPRKVARFGAADVRRLLGDEGIVRNRLKVRAAIENARAMLLVQHERGSFDAYAWSFVGGKPLVNRPRSMADVPARSRSRTRSASRCASAAFASSARPSSMLSCRLAGWSTTMSADVFVPSGDELYCTLTSSKSVYVASPG